MLQVRRAHEAFGMGEYGPVPADSERVLAFTRTYDGAEYREDAKEHAETLLCVFNLAAHPVTTTLDLTGFERRTMRDLFGGHEFPAIGTEGTLTLTLGSHGFYWLRVRPLREDGGADDGDHGPARARGSRRDDLRGRAPGRETCLTSSPGPGPTGPAPYAPGTASGPWTAVRECLRARAAVSCSAEPTGRSSRQDGRTTE